MCACRHADASHVSQSRYCELSCMLCTPQCRRAAKTQTQRYLKDALHLDGMDQILATKTASKQHVVHCKFTESDVCKSTWKSCLTVPVTWVIHDRSSTEYRSCTTFHTCIHCGFKHCHTWKDQTQSKIMTLCLTLQTQAGTKMLELQPMSRSWSYVPAYRLAFLWSRRAA